MPFAYDKSARATPSPAMVKMTYFSEPPPNQKAVIVGAPIPLFEIASAKGGNAILQNAKTDGAIYQIIDEANDNALTLLTVKGYGRSMTAHASLMQERFKNALHLAEKTLASEPAIYEPRLLEISNIRATALWLHNPNDETSDRFIPLSRPVQITTAFDTQDISSDLHEYNIVKNPSPKVCFDPAYMQNAEKIETCCPSASFASAAAILAFIGNALKPSRDTIDKPKPDDDRLNY